MNLRTIFLLCLGLCAFRPVAAEDSDFFTHIHTEKAMANVTIAPGQVGPVIITIQLETTDELPLIAEAVSVTLTGPQAGAAALATVARRTDDGQWQAMLSVPSNGRWDMGLEITLSKNDKVSVASPILIQ